MNPLPKLVLLPGLDGTGTLLHDFSRALPQQCLSVTMEYPRQSQLSYAELSVLVQSLIPASDPFVLIAESFSTPIAIRLASQRPLNLVGVVLCAGFARSPLSPWLSSLAASISSLPFLLPPPDTVARYLLVGRDAPHSLVSAVQSAIASVDPSVLANRLKSVLQCDLTAELTQITVPILYLQATRDRLVPASSLAFIQSILTSLLVREISGPHLLFQREPHLTADIVTKFIAAL